MGQGGTQDFFFIQQRRSIQITKALIGGELFAALRTFFHSMSLTGSSIIGAEPSQPAGEDACDPSIPVGEIDTKPRKISWQQVCRRFELSETLPRLRDGLCLFDHAVL
jgi:hypothetical protein